MIQKQKEDYEMLLDKEEQISEVAKALTQNFNDLIAEDMKQNVEMKAKSQLPMDIIIKNKLISPPKNQQSIIP
jgi:hypothetical protein